MGIFFCERRGREVGFFWVGFFVRGGGSGVCFFLGVERREFVFFCFFLGVCGLFFFEIVFYFWEGFFDVS